jgi:hypothetical protein
MHKCFIWTFGFAISLAATSAHAITWGVPDEGEHPHVGTLLFVQNGVGYFSCSGTMIAPRVMLTAGHWVTSCRITSGPPNHHGRSGELGS